MRPYNEYSLLRPRTISTNQPFISIFLLSFFYNCHNPTSLSISLSLAFSQNHDIYLRILLASSFLDLYFNPLSSSPFSHSLCFRLLRFLFHPPFIISVYLLPPVSSSSSSVVTGIDSSRRKMPSWLNAATSISMLKTRFATGSQTHEIIYAGNSAEIRVPAWELMQ